MLIAFSNIKKSILTNLKTPLFILIIILKETIYIKTIIQTILIKTIIQIDKHKAKYIITASVPIIIIKKCLLFFFVVCRNERKEHKFWQQKHQKSDFYNKNKKIFNIDDIDVNKILVSKKEQYGEYSSFKYFIGYNDNNIIRPLYLELSQMKNHYTNQ